ncbi:radical SAM family heme chaperone HemW, partial [Enterococcus faecalis]
MKFLEKENFTNVSIVLIFAFPGQSLDSFRDTLTRALALDLPHYSLYSLFLDNKTMFMYWVRLGRFLLPVVEFEAQMFVE